MPSGTASGKRDGNHSSRLKDFDPFGNIIPVRVPLSGCPYLGTPIWTSRKEGLRLPQGQPEAGCVYTRTERQGPQAGVQPKGRLR